MEEEINFDNFYTTEHVEGSMNLKEYIDKYYDEDVEYKLCKECPNYGKVWMCPPHRENSLEVWKKFEEKYEKLDFIITKINFTKEARSRTYSLDEILMKIVPNTYNKENYKLMADLRKKEKETGGLFINAGPCILCTKGCQRPLGKPCKKPDKARRGWDELGTRICEAVEDHTDLELKWFDLPKGIIPEYTCVITGFMHN